MNSKHVEHEYNITLTSENIENLFGKFDAVIMGVSHTEFLNMDLRKLLADSKQGVVYDVKGVINREIIDGRL